MRASEDGFTLIELLVVILVIAILAAIAVPVFARQREKGYAAQTKSALKHAATAVESYAVTHGDYGALNSNPQLPVLLAQEGFNTPSFVTLVGVRSTGDKYCIEIEHRDAAATNEWRQAVYMSKNGSPTPLPDICPNPSGF